MDADAFVCRKGVGSVLNLADASKAVLQFAAVNNKVWMRGPEMSRKGFDTWHIHKIAQFANNIDEYRGRVSYWCHRQWIYWSLPLLEMRRFTVCHSDLKGPSKTSFKWNG